MATNEFHDDCPAAHYEETAYPAYGDPETTDDGAPLMGEFDFHNIWAGLQKYWAKICIVGAVIVFLSFVIFTCESVTQNSILIEEQNNDHPERQMGYQTLLFSFTDMSARYITANRTLSLNDFYVVHENDRIPIIHHRKIQIRYKGDKEYIHTETWEEVEVYYRSLRFLGPPSRLTENSTMILVDEETGKEHVLAHTRNPKKSPWLEGRIMLRCDAEADVPIKNISLKPNFNGLILVVQFEIRYRSRLLFRMEYKYWEQSNRLAKHIWGR